MKMMSVSGNKKKGRLNPNNHKLGKSKFYASEKNMSGSYAPGKPGKPGIVREKLDFHAKPGKSDGIYGNSKLMYTAASLVGCVVQIQVQNGAIFEGVLRTFSHQLDIVLETAHKVNSKSHPTKGISPTVSNLIASYPFEGGIFDKLIFKLSDVILMVASTVDMDYAVKDNFTDTAISKFNGQVKERELEPWEDVNSDSEGTVGFSIDDEEGTNGWDANDMFRTNAEKYGVKSSYDHSLQDYTVPLMKKDTEEYKLQEAMAMKIAQEIETNNSYQSRIQLENGDEEDRFSAVIRTTTPTTEDSLAPSKYVVSQKRRNSSGPKRQLPSNTSKPAPNIPSQSLPYSTSLPVLEETTSLPIASCSSVTAATVPKPGASLKCPAGDVSLVNEASVEHSENPPLAHAPPKMPLLYSTQTLPPRIERRRENEKKFSKHKGRTDEIEEFKKFSSNFKLSEEKDLQEDCRVVDSLSSHLERTRVLEKEEDKSANNVVKYSTLNPNAKEFVFNPNAKAFTPRSMSVVTPPVQAPPMQDQMIPSQMIHPQPLFTAMAAPQYVMQATPVSVAITSPFATSVPQPPPRFRKASGQALLAPSGLPAPSQLTVQYSSPPAMLHASTPPQTAVGYPQMNFVVGPRVVSPQPVGVIPTSHSVSYCDTSHLPTHFIMSAHPGASHTAVTTPHTLQQGQPHSNHHHHHHHHPPQCQTPVLHPSPSPVHQVPPPPPPHSQPPTPTAVMYTGQHPLQAAAGHHTQPVSHPMHHPGAFQPHQVVLMQQQQQQQPVSAGHQPHHSLHMLHSQTGAHMGHLLPQMTLIPTSTALSSAPTPPYIQHP